MNTIVTDFIWEYKWVLISVVAIVGFVVLFLFRSEDSWKKFAGWLIDKKSDLLKERIRRKRESIKKKKDDIEDVDEKLKEIEEKNKKIERANKNKDLDELAEELKNMGY